LPPKQAPHRPGTAPALGLRAGCDVPPLYRRPTWKGRTDHVIPQLAAELEKKTGASSVLVLFPFFSLRSFPFLIGRAARRGAELFAGQTDQAAEIALPNLLGSVGVAGLEPVDPLGDG